MRDIYRNKSLAKLVDLLGMQRISLKRIIGKTVNERIYRLKDFGRLNIDEFIQYKSSNKDNREYEYFRKNSKVLNNLTEYYPKAICKAFKD